MPYEVENVKSLKRGFKDHEKAQELLERIAKEVGFLFTRHIVLSIFTRRRRPGR